MNHCGATPDRIWVPELAQQSMRVIGESLRVQGNWVRMSEYPVLSMLFRLEPSEHEGAGNVQGAHPCAAHWRLQAGRAQ